MQIHRVYQLLAVATIAGLMSMAQTFARSSVIGDQQSENEKAIPLSSLFFDLFRKRKDLTRENVDRYFKDHPTEIASFERYIKELVFQSYMSAERADALLAVASQYKGKKQPVVTSLENSTESPELEPLLQSSDSNTQPIKGDPKEGAANEYFMGVVDALEPYVPPVASTEGIPYQESRAIAIQLGLSFPVSLLRAQKKTLSPTFAEQFRSVDSFFSPAYREYFKRAPDEAWAARRYLQNLTDLNIISTEQATQLVVAAFDEASRSASRSDSVVLARDSAVDRGMTDESSSLDLSGLPKGVLPTAVENYVSGVDSPKVIEFGRAPEIPGAKDPSAAEQAILAIEEQERRRKLARTAAKIMRMFAENNIPRAKIADRVSQIFKEEAEQEAESVASEQANVVVQSIFDAGKASVRLNDGNTEYSVAGLKAFETDPSSPIFSFGQIGAESDSDKTTVNIGIGIRALDPSQTVMVGANTFYDREINEGHDRAGIGIELISAPFMFSANRYYALSGSKQISSTSKETALSGRDVKFRGALPYMPGLFAEYDDFRWYGADGGSDLYGRTYGFSGRLSENFSVDVGRTLYGSGQAGTNSAMLTYNYIDQKERSPRLFDFSPYPWMFKPIQQAERYRLVDRESKVITQTSSTTGSSLSISFTSI